MIYWLIFQANTTATNTGFSIQRQHCVNVLDIKKNLIQPMHTHISVLSLSCLPGVLVCTISRCSLSVPRSCALIGQARNGLQLSSTGCQPSKVCVHECMGLCAWSDMV